MSAPLPTIYCDCRRLQLHTEEVVRRFTRYHKYTVGTELRQQAFAVMRGVHEAVYGRIRPAAPAQWQVRRHCVVRQILKPEGEVA